MNVQLVMKVFEASGWRSATQKLVLLEMANSADRKGIVRKSQSEIAADSGMSRRTVASWMAEFELNGIVNRQGHGRYQMAAEAFAGDLSELLKSPQPTIKTMPGAMEEVARLKTIRKPTQGIVFGTDGWPALQEMER